MVSGWQPIIRHVQITVHIALAEQGTQPVKQIQSHWQRCTLTADSDTHFHDKLPVSLDIWSLLAASLAKSLPATDEFDDSDAAVMAAVAFTVQTLKYPLEAVKQNKAAGWHTIVTAGKTSPEAGVGGGTVKGSQTGQSKAGAGSPSDDSLVKKNLMVLQASMRFTPCQCLLRVALA